MRNFQKLNIDVRGHGSGRVKTFCPFCHETRRNKRDRSLSVDIDKGLYLCHYCGAKGYVPDEAEERARELRRLQRDEAMRRPAQRKYPRPAWHPELMQLPPEIATYLTEERKISLETARRLRVTAQFVNGTRMTQMEQMTAEKNLLTTEHTDSTEKNGGDECHPDGKLVTRSSSLVTEKENPRSSVQSASSACHPIQRILAFNYFDRGQLVNIKTRTMDKQFTLVRGAELIPYNVDAIYDRPVCYITEGEFDTLTLVECGFPETISVPGGGNSNLSWMDRFVETHFEDKEQIILALDDDPVGLKLRDELTRRLGAERCRVVRWTTGCKDANEVLCRHGRDEVARCIEAAEEVPIDGVFTAEDVGEGLDALFENGMQRGAGVGLFNLDKLCTFEPGRFMVITGRPGEGKSELLDELVLRLCLRHGWRPAYFTPENVPIEYHLRKLIEKLTGYKFEQGGRMTPDLYRAAKRWCGENVHHILPPDDRYTLDEVLQRARQLVARRGVRIVVIDPLNRLETDEKESAMTELQLISDRLNRMVRFAAQHRVLFILVAHPRKVNRANLNGEKRRVEMNDINGSADFGNKADYCLIVDRDDAQRRTTVYVDKVRFKHLGTRGECTLHYDPVSGRYLPLTYEPDGLGGLKPHIHWTNFNIRWVNPRGESQMIEEEERLQEARENKGQYRIREE
ncbi:MAG: AAA family ATPase [Bacteroidaceae bacterium]|nr:AAA family ATPase [Bacteroidaceae bacterium]